MKRYCFVCVTAVIISLAGGLLLSLESNAAINEVCGNSTPGQRAWSFCIYRDSESTNQDVLFYFHGRGEEPQGNERLWMQPGFFTEQVRDHWRQNRRGAPIVFAVSFGSIWVLADRDASPLNVKMEIMENEVLPRAITEIGPFHGSILVAGDSMGGLNASVFAMKTSLPVAKLAAVCPLVANLSPFASEAEINAFLAENVEADPEMFNLVLGLNRFAYPTVEEWSEISPLEIARRRSSAFSFSYYSSAGRGDRFGIFSGAEALAKEMQRLGNLETFQPLSGDHCAIDPISLADFLVP